MNANDHKGVLHDIGKAREDAAAGLDRRAFVKTLGTALTAGGVAAPEFAAGSAPSAPSPTGGDDWPSLKTYDQDHLARIALPIGGIGTGTVSLGGKGDLRDWEVMNRPAKGFVPSYGEAGPFFALFVRQGPATFARLLEGPLEFEVYEGSHGSRAPNENLPRFRHASFDAAYPFGRVKLSDPESPVEVELRAFNPLIPCDAEASGFPVAILTFVLRNKRALPIEASICASLPNFVGIDGSRTETDWKGDAFPSGAKGNRNRFRESSRLRGLFLDSQGVDPAAEAWGSLALATPDTDSPITVRTDWAPMKWGSSWLDFWDDFSNDGRLDPRPPGGADLPMASLAVETHLAAGESRAVRFLLGWHFPNRYTWTRRSTGPQAEDRIGNHYTVTFQDAWDALEQIAPRLDELEKRTRLFVRSFLAADLPEVVKEAALFNLSTLRTQTCFRTEDGRFYGWEGVADHQGCCHGSCTHVWNYEQATAHLFGSLALSMREVEFGHATNDEGIMSFRVNLPLSRAQSFGKAAADGQMGCIMKMYRDWRLSADDAFLVRHWPKVRKALEFCWVPGGWDADRDGVMEGCQHNTMDVEYYGPNPQMSIWYLGALRAAGEMADHLGEAEFGTRCRQLFERGSAWVDEHLFNGEYYEHQVRPPRSPSEIAPGLLVGMGAVDPSNPDYQLGAGCLVDQLVGQFFAHVCGLGYLVRREHVEATLRSIRRYNQPTDLNDHFNCMRSFALGDETGLLMASYPKGRPANPFPYFTEVMTGFEYTAAVGMIYEGQEAEGIECIRHIRARYDGRKRSPFDEAECGHHYARAMASWAALHALSGFDYSALRKTMVFAPRSGRYFWAGGWAWGDCVIEVAGDSAAVRLEVHEGRLPLSGFVLRDFATKSWDKPQILEAGSSFPLSLRRE